MRCSHAASGCTSLWRSWQTDKASVKDYLLLSFSIHTWDDMDDGLWSIILFIILSLGKSPLNYLIADCYRCLLSAMHCCQPNKENYGCHGIRTVVVDLYKQYVAMKHVWCLDSTCPSDEVSMWLYPLLDLWDMKRLIQISCVIVTYCRTKFMSGSYQNKV